MPQLSVVVPVFNERDNIAPLVARDRRGAARPDRRSRSCTWTTLAATTRCAVLRRRCWRPTRTARAAHTCAKRPEHRDAQRRQGRARRLDRHARRRWPERSGRHSEAAGRARPADGRVKLFAGWRVEPPRQRQQALGLEDRQRDPLAPAARRHPGHRLRASSCSSARSSSTCRTSTTCTATCRRWSSAPAGSTVSVPVNHRERTRRRVQVQQPATAPGSASSTCAASAG